MQKKFAESIRGLMDCLSKFMKIVEIVEEYQNHDKGMIYFETAEEHYLKKIIAVLEEE